MMPSKIEEHPILFSTEMVRAILDGRKTQTRRIIKPQPLKYFPEGAASNNKPPRHIWWSFIYPTKHGSDTHIYRKCPYGKVGDRLWVKEDYKYLIQMARTFLEITNIRVERVQNISGPDVYNEGCPPECASYRMWFSHLWNTINAKRGYGWDKNPWVWVIEFKSLPS